MTDNVAMLSGYTEEYFASSADGMVDIPILVVPGTDLDSRFRCWDMDEQEFIFINGWNWMFDRQPDTRQVEPYLGEVVPALFNASPMRLELVMLDVLWARQAYGLRIDTHQTLWNCVAA